MRVILLNANGSLLWRPPFSRQSCVQSSEATHISPRPTPRRRTLNTAQIQFRSTLYLLYDNQSDCLTLDTTGTIANTHSAYGITYSHMYENCQITSLGVRYADLCYSAESGVTNKCSSECRTASPVVKKHSLCQTVVGMLLGRHRSHCEVRSESEQR